MSTSPPGGNGGVTLLPGRAATRRAGSVRPPHPSSPHRLRRRWRRWLRRRLDPLTSWLLGALVSVSLALAAVLWLVTPPLPTPLLAGSGAAYVIGDALGQASDATLLQPARVVLFYAGGSDVALGDPAANPVFGTLWGAARTVLTHVTPGELAAAHAVSQEAVAQFVAQGGGEQAALEVDLGPRLTWAQWWDVFGGGAGWRGGPGPAFDRLYIAPTPAATYVFLLSGVTGLRIALPKGVGQGLAAMLQAQQGQPQPSGYAVHPLAAVPDTSFAVEPGIVVPVTPDWRPVALHAEQVDGARMAAATLGDPLAVRIYRAPDGTVTYSNPQHWALQVTTGGSVSLTAPLPSGATTTLDWLAGLYAASRYVGRAGGWPPNAWLSSVTPVYPGGSCTLTICTPDAYAYGFEARFEGLPVIGPAPAVDVTAAGGGVTAYARHVPVAGSTLTSGGGASWLSAAAVVSQLEHDPPPSLYAPPLVVDDIYPAWVPLPVAGVLEPAWVVRFAPLTGGPARLVLVDALRGQVLDVLTGD